LREAAASQDGPDYLVLAPDGPPPGDDRIRILLEAMEARASYSYFPGARALDVAVGRSRWGIANGVASFPRRLLLRVLFGVWIPDPDALCALRRDFLEKIVVHSTGAEAAVEIVARARRAGLLVRAVPCEGEPSRRVGLSGLLRARRAIAKG
jgi:hypothetical protein